MNAKPTIVIVHGAFADASSWNGVIERLQEQDYDVVAPPNPLRGVHFDTAYVASFVNQIDGPVLLVAHSYGGAVTSNAAAKASNVVGLVYVAALIPEEGERLADVHSKDSILNPVLIERQYPTGSDGQTAPEYTIDPAHFRRAFAADVPEGRSRLMAAEQRPIAGGAFADTSGPVAWKTLPSWAIIATEDVGAGTDIVRSMAERAGAKVTELRGSHAIMISQPQAVTNVILEAANFVCQRAVQTVLAGPLLEGRGIVEACEPETIRWSTVGRKAVPHRSNDSPTLLNPIANKPAHLHTFRVQTSRLRIATMTKTKVDDGRILRGECG